MLGRLITLRIRQNKSPFFVTSWPLRFLRWSQQVRAIWSCILKPASSWVRNFSLSNICLRSCR